jgi:hypothetical protein
MKKAKPVSAFLCMVVLCASAAGVGFALVIRVGIIFGVLVGVLGLSVLLGALLRAPEGYEDETGFRICERRKRAARAQRTFAVSGSRS